MSTALKGFQHLLVVLFVTAVLAALVGQLGNDYYLRIAFTMCTYYLCAAGMPVWCVRQVACAATGRTWSSSARHPRARWSLTKAFPSTASSSCGSRVPSHWTLHSPPRKAER